MGRLTVLAPPTIDTFRVEDKTAAQVARTFEDCCREGAVDQIHNFHRDRKRLLAGVHFDAACETAHTEV